MLAGLAHPPYFSGANYFLILDTCVHVTALMTTNIRGRGNEGEGGEGEGWRIVYCCDGLFYQLKLFTNNMFASIYLRQYEY